MEQIQLLEFKNEISDMPDSWFYKEKVTEIIDQLISTRVQLNIAVEALKCIERYSKGEALVYVQEIKGIASSALNQINGEPKGKGDETHD